ncbi:MAG: phosphate regulon sensor protein PhoR, partial [Shewanella sp.]
MFDSYSGYRLFTRLAGYVILCLLVGLLIGQPLWVLLIALLGLVVWHYQQLARLNYWLWR